ncbi:50S ribosomal protein L20, partial [Agathobacter rectalis]|uniref:50S ribosomal protein L20 n=4 Tax=Bacteria TaxID=2 RepID=UPI0027D2E85A
SGLYAFRDRKANKRNFRELWIARINAGARQNGISYSKLMHGLKLANIDMNRKMLADLAVNDAEAFKAVVDEVKKALN